MTTDQPNTSPAGAPAPVTTAPTSTRSASPGTSDRVGRRWFDGFALRTEPDGTTVLRGPVVDQAALHGLLQRLRDLGIPLVSLTRVSPDQPLTDGRSAHSTQGR